MNLYYNQENGRFGTFSDDLGNPWIKLSSSEISLSKIHGFIHQYIEAYGSTIVMDADQVKEIFEDWINR